MKVVVKKAGENFGEVREIENELEPLQEIVDGWIETVHWGDGILLVLNEEGKLKDLPFNFSLGMDVILGDVVFVGQDGEDMASLSDEQLDLLRKQRIIK